MQINKKKPISGCFWRIISLFPGSGKTTGKGTSSRSEAPLLEELEPRLLFSADSIAGLLDYQHATFQSYDSGLAESQLFQTEDTYQTSASLSVSYEIVFVDTGVDGYQQLLADLQDQQGGSRRFEVYLLDSTRDGIEQISERLAGNRDVDAIHIISHGGDGRVSLGNSWLDINSLNEYADAIAGWGQSLGEDADLLIYGCELAGSSEGRALTNALGGLTGADVAASDDLTGLASLGGDWDLEYQTGAVETGIAFSKAVQQGWDAVLATISVGTVNDQIDGVTANINSLIAAPGVDGVISLREAIIAANNTPGLDTINLAAGVYRLTQTGVNEDQSASGDLDIRDDLIINGADANATIIDGNGTDRVFDVLTGAGNVTLTNISVRNGATAGNGGGIRAGNNTGQLYLDRVIVTNNRAGQGAGIYNDSTMTLTDSVVSYNGDTNTIGGGIYNHKNIVLDRVTVSNNQADTGAGLYIHNLALSTSLTNVTVSTNTAQNPGGGMYTGSDVSVMHSTFTLNTADTGGGIRTKGAASVELVNSIVEGNTGTSANNDLQGTFSSRGVNLIGDTSGASGLSGSDLTGASANLLPLASNGGFGQTHLPGAGSVAIDNGTSVTGVPAQDQRGVSRPLDANGDSVALPDIGTVEITPDVRVNTTTTDNQETNAEAFGSNRAIAMDANGNYVVVWSSQGNQDGSGWGVFGQRFLADGTAVGNEFQVNINTTGDQRWASVAMDDSGRFAVVWTSNNAQDGNGEGVFMRRFNNDGTAIDANDLQVNTFTNGDQKNPSIAVNGTGDMVIVWSGSGAEGIYAKQFDFITSVSGGQLPAAEITVAAEAAAVDPNVDINSAGKFVVVWHDGTDVFAQRYGAGGAADGSRINVDILGKTDYPSVVLHDSGKFNVAYHSYRSGLEGVWLRSFDAGGNGPLSRAVATGDVNNSSPSIIKGVTGDMLVVWQGPGDGDQTGIYGKKYASGGSSVGNKFIINRTTTGIQQFPSVAMQDLDNFTVVWSGEGPGDNSGVFLRQYDSGTVVSAQPPVANTVTTTGDEDSSSITITLTGYDSDGLVSSFQLSTLPPNGKLYTDSGLMTLAVTGTDYPSGSTLDLFFVPDPDWNGTTDFQFFVTNDSGLSSTPVTASVTVNPINDNPVGNPVITGTVEEDQLLSADITAISDADGLGSFSYQWFRDGSMISGATGASYSLGDADVGASIHVSVSYLDAQGTTETVSSTATGPVVNVNDAPTGSVTIDNMNPVEGDTLNVSHTITDADGLSGAVSYQWYRGNTAIAGASGQSYVTVQADVGAQLSVKASYTDDQGTSESVNSAATAAVGNVNNPPAGGVLITGIAQEDQTLAASNTLTDIDGIGSVSYQWQRIAGSSV